MDMTLPEVAAFVRAAPIAVGFRAVFESLFRPANLDEWFGRTAARQAVNCDLCNGGEPFCVQACPHDAAFRIDGKGLLKLVGGG